MIKIKKIFPCVMYDSKRLALGTLSVFPFANITIIMLPRVLFLDVRRTYQQHFNVCTDLI